MWSKASGAVTKRQHMLLVIGTYKLNIIKNLTVLVFTNDIKLSSQIGFSIGKTLSGLLTRAI